MNKIFFKNLKFSSINKILKKWPKIYKKKILKTHKIIKTYVNEFLAQIAVYRTK